MKRALLIAVVALAAHAQLATAPLAAAPPDPASPDASAPSFSYESAFTGFRGFREAPLMPWRDVNDEVARVGGHLGIFRAPPASKGDYRAGQKPAAGDTVQEPASQAGRPR